MGSIKNSIYYHEAIHEINYSFGDFYLFDGFVVAEISEGITFSWDQHAKKLTEDLTYLYDSNGHDLVLISNRNNSYSFKPTDWKKFFKQDYNLKAYAIVSYSKRGHSIALIEKLFVKAESKRFKSLDNAIVWAKQLTTNMMVS